MYGLAAVFYLHTNYTRITHEKRSSKSTPRKLIVLGRICISLYKDKNKKYEMEDKHIDSLVAAMCRGLARYDANEVLQRDTDARTTDNKGHNADYAD